MDLETAIEGRQRHWYGLLPTSPLVGVSLAEANIRRVTGATIMAVDRHKHLHRYPTGEMVLATGDRYR